jgi:hypothetical protein
MVNDLLGHRLHPFCLFLAFTFPPNEDVIPMQLIMGGFVVLLLMILTLIVKSRLSVENPASFSSRWSSSWSF